VPGAADPTVITGVLAHFLTFGKLPELDALGRPMAFYGQSIHDRCYRRRSTTRACSPGPSTTRCAQGWCLYRLGCKGPMTTTPAPREVEPRHQLAVESGHGCLAAPTELLDAAASTGAVDPDQQRHADGNAAVARRAIGIAAVSPTGRRRPARPSSTKPSRLINWVKADGKLNGLPALVRGPRSTSRWPSSHWRARSLVRDPGAGRKSLYSEPKGTDGPASPRSQALGALPDIVKRGR